VRQGKPLPVFPTHLPTNPPRAGTTLAMFRLLATPLPSSASLLGRFGSLSYTQARASSPQTDSVCHTIISTRNQHFAFWQSVRCPSSSKEDVVFHSQNC